jgi:hypothetical protein
MRVAVRGYIAASHKQTFVGRRPAIEMKLNEVTAL